MSIEKGWFKVKTAAEFADVSRKTIHRWLEQGLRHSRIGGIILIKREHLNEWLESHQADKDVDAIVEEVWSEFVKGKTND